MSASFLARVGIPRKIAGVCHEKPTGGVPSGPLANLTGCTLVVWLRRTDIPTAPLVSFTATLDDAPNGAWSYQITASDYVTYLPSGSTWNLWLVATPAPGGSDGIYPDDSYLTLQVTP